MFHQFGGFLQRTNFCTEWRLRGVKKERNVMNVYCNPVSFSYKYQFNGQQDGSVVASRESADPSMVLFKGKYFIFPSMTAGFLYSDDLVH